MRWLELSISAFTSPDGSDGSDLLGSKGLARMPGDADVAAAYAAAIDALLAGNTRFDAESGREVVRVLALANERLL